MIALRCTFLEAGLIGNRGKIMNGMRRVFLSMGVMIAFLFPLKVFAERETIGWAEKVYLPEIGQTMDAKIDTGATTSSIDVDKIEPFQKDGNPWVRFGLRVTKTKTVTVERAVFRHMKVYRSGAIPDLRAVVLLRACLGGYSKMTQFNLKKRDRMSYRMLIGRRFFRDKFAVAADTKHMSKPVCTGAPEPQGGVPEKEKRN